MIAGAAARWSDATGETPGRAMCLNEVLLRDHRDRAAGNQRLATNGIVGVCRTLWTNNATISFAPYDLFCDLRFSISGMATNRQLGLKSAALLKVFAHPEVGLRCCESEPVTRFVDRYTPFGVCSIKAFGTNVSCQNPKNRVSKSKPPKTRSRGGRYEGEANTPAPLLRIHIQREQLSVVR